MLYACVKNPYPFIKYYHLCVFLSLSLSSLYLTNVSCKNKKSILSLFFQQMKSLFLNIYRIISKSKSIHLVSYNMLNNVSIGNSITPDSRSLTPTVKIILLFSSMQP